LQQGSILVLDITESGNNLTKDSCGSNLISYWSPNKSLESEAVSIFKGSFDNAVDELEELMLDSVGLQMHADVPLGAFLSGGVDSSTIVSLMQKLTNRQVQTFTIGFDDARFNEATHSLSVASYLETNHTELYINDTDIQNIIPKLPFIYDEPFADPSQIPTYLVSQLAKQQVTVSLSGDGADEIFCGYNKYRLGQKISSIPLRRLWGGALKLLPWGVIEDIGAISPGTFEKRLKHERLEFISKLFLAKDNIKLAEILSKSHSHPERFTICNGSYNTVFDTSSYTNIPENYQRDAMALDRIGYLPENILTKVDRASMAVSLESRAPFLDHRICEFVAKLPRSYLSNGNDNKKILRELLYRYVPRSLVDRPKAGFSVPLADWLRGDLYEWAMELLQSDKNEDEFLNLANCRKTLLSHRRCERDYSPVLWPILMFQSWRKVWL